MFKKRLILLMIVFSAFPFENAHPKRKGSHMAKPEIIAHRGGKLNFPENTLCAFRHNVQQKVAALELDVQVTKDDVVVLYHPEDLSMWTESKGAIADKTAAEVTALDTSAKYQGPQTYKTQCNPEELRIPMLNEVLEKIPNMPIVVDFKSLPAETLIAAVVKSVPEKEWPRLRFYSTSAEHTKALHAQKPDAVIFEDREPSLKRLMIIDGTNDCKVEKKSATMDCLRTSARA